MGGSCVTLMFVTESVMPLASGAPFGSQTHVMTTDEEQVSTSEGETGPKKRAGEPDGDGEVEVGVDDAVAVGGLMLIGSTVHSWRIYFAKKQMPKPVATDSSYFVPFLPFPTCSSLKVLADNALRGQY
ncbi:hypothetical protein BDP27DRAFT_931305 [Rhodocollybia butyracea]|uniref:Uncharacterized protein n=1 Tax=Rhodocollybia butyracea TaxID=206335 RepID=A0A9P5PRJ6_9AGAR|nr:hypothetical protein BDP27DRAFT_931305 [Rhodocollybia butyracea]